MDKAKTVYRYAFAYLMWIVSFILWVVFIFLSREAIVGLLSTYYYQDNFQRMKVIQFFNQAYPFLLSIAWLALMLITESYFRNGAKKNDLTRRVSWVIGPEILLIFISNFLQGFLLGYGSVPITFWLILFVELVAGVGLIWLAVKTPKPSRQDETLNAS